MQLQPAVALLVLVLQLAPSADAHGYMATPAARNWLHAHTDNFYDEMSLNHEGPTPPYNVCGAQVDNDTRFSAGGLFANNPAAIVATYKQGQDFTVTTQIIVHHFGRWEVRLCPLSNPSIATEQKELSDACLDQYRLPRSDGGGRYVYLTAGKMVYTQSYRLPPNVTCARCVIQWRYVTGNSCYAPGTNVSFVQTYSPNLPACNPATYLTIVSPPPEKFWNCADVTITAGPPPANQKPLPSPTPEPTPVPEATAPPPPAPNSPALPGAKTPPATPAPCTPPSSLMYNYGQCGGLSGSSCSCFTCTAGQYPGVKCNPGYTCYSYNAYYAQCIPTNTVPTPTLAAASKSPSPAKTSPPPAKTLPSPAKTSPPPAKG